jgi:hypothetical protein
MASQREHHALVVWRLRPQPLDERPATPAKAAPAAQSSSPVDPTKAVVSFLADIDDLLDTVHDSASFAAVKPKLICRAREQAALAAQHPNQGMSRLSPSASRQWQDAANRHMRSLAHAIEAVPAVEDFFADDLAAILSPKE